MPIPENDLEGVNVNTGHHDLALVGAIPACVEVVVFPNFFSPSVKNFHADGSNALSVNKMEVVNLIVIGAEGVGDKNHLVEENKNVQIIIGRTTV